MVEDLRADKGLGSLKEAEREPTYIHAAANLNLGTDDLDMIELRKS